MYNQSNLFNSINHFTMGKPKARNSVVHLEDLERLTRDSAEVARLRSQGAYPTTPALGSTRARLRDAFRDAVGERPLRSGDLG